MSYTTAPPAQHWVVVVMAIGGLVSVACAVGYFLLGEPRAGWDSLCFGAVVLLLAREMHSRRVERGLTLPGRLQ